MAEEDIGLEDKTAHVIVLNDYHVFFSLLKPRISTSPSKTIENPLVLKHENIGPWMVLIWNF